MAVEKVNRLHILYNAESKIFLYGAIHIVDGSVDNQWWEKPFVVSKKRPDGEEIVYGTVKRTLQKIVAQTERLNRFYLETQARLKAEGITPPPPDDPILQESKLADRILDEQDELIEDVLVATSVNVRILSEIFPNKLKKYKVSVYDYEDGEVGKIKLSKIADLLLHNRYLVIKSHQVVDLLSDEKSMADDPQMGLKIDFPEYLSEVEKVVNGLTVRDLIGKLWGLTKALSTSASIKDIVFLTQNLYTLGDSVVGDSISIAGGPLKTILDRVAGNYIDRVFPNNSAPKGETIPISVVFRTPRFYLEPDVDHKQIRTEVEVNGSSETLVMDYEEFFQEVSKASGNARLYGKPSR